MTTTSMTNSPACEIKAQQKREEQTVAPNAQRLKAPRMVTPAADIVAYNDHYEVHLALPGVHLEDISITAEKSVLLIEGADRLAQPEQARSIHREFGGYHYRRSLSLNDDIDSDRISAQLAHGILTITLPKRAEVAPRKIAIHNSSN